ncbi:Tautomerase/MIF superfamily [Aspergillus desertorum]
MPQRRHRIDFSLLRRRQNYSSASSSDICPGIPVLQSPMSFHAMASPEVVEATLKRSKLDRAPVKPSMFFEDMDEEDDGPVAKSAVHDHKDASAPRTAQKTISGESPSKTQFFEDSFNSRALFVPSVARIGQDSLVMIEVLLNVSVKDEDAVISRITTRMAQIYQRSESFMFVSMQVIPSLRFGASTVPAYSMKIFALPYLIAPITNLRSTILIQAALHDILHIQPSRGIILYIPVAEENMATNNTTMMGEVARLQSDTHGRGRESGIFKSLSRTLSRRKKSSSGASAPLSVATTSSWAARSDVQEVKPAAVSESEGTNASADEGSVPPARSRTLRLFGSRRVPERSDHSNADLEMGC